MEYTEYERGPNWSGYIRCWNCGFRNLVTSEALMGRSEPRPPLLRPSDVFPQQLPKRPIAWAVPALCFAFPILPLIGLVGVILSRLFQRKPTGLVYDETASTTKRMDAPAFDNGWVRPASVINRGNPDDPIWDPSQGVWRARGEVFVSH